MGEFHRGNGYDESFDEPAIAISVEDAQAVVTQMEYDDAGFETVMAPAHVAVDMNPARFHPVEQSAHALDTSAEPPAVKVKLVLSMPQSLGDSVCFTAIPRALHKAWPNRFEIAIRTPFHQLWEGNPYVTWIPDNATDVVKIDCHDPAVHESNQRNVHMIEAFCEYIGWELWARKLVPAPTLKPDKDHGLRGDIYLSAAERGWMSLPHEHYGVQRYWLINAGGKKDFSVKWPIPSVMQAVVDHFRGRIQFVQVGMNPRTNPNHVAPKLSGVIDAIGETTQERQLIRLVHSASGVLSGITALTHLAAAVPRPDWMKRERASVVIAGGRENRAWYSYPTTSVLDVVGRLECCSSGGCWKSRTVALRDGDVNNDSVERRCERVVNDYPKCMWMIEAVDIIRTIERCLTSE